MLNNSLTKKEEHVLYGLVRHPLLNNRELSETLGLKQSTVTAIHRRLRERGYVRTVRIPLLQNLGCEMLAVTYSTFSSSMSLDARLRSSSEIAERYDEVFWAVSEKTQGITLQLSRNYTDIREKIEELEKVYFRENVTREPGITLLPFPFKLARVLNFFDLAPFLRDAFDLKGDDKLASHETGGREAALNDAEKQIYYALIKHPDLSDKELAGVIPTSRHTIARARKRFEDDSLIRTVRTVDLKKLGFEMLVLNHFSFNVRASAEKMSRGIEALMGTKQPIFMVLGNIDGVSLVPYRSFDDFREHSGEVADINKKYDMFSREPVSLLFSTSAMVYVNDHDYAPMVKKVLGI